MYDNLQCSNSGEIIIREHKPDLEFGKAIFTEVGKLGKLGTAETG